MRRVAAALAAVLLVASCGSGSGSGGGPDRRQVTVLAAASLTDVFTSLARVYEREHPGVRVRLSFGGSSALAAQIKAGAPADVFASADAETMRQVVDADLAEGAPQVFARNQLVLVTPAKGGEKVHSLKDLARAGLTVGLCEPEVPCGAAATEALAQAGVKASVDTYEQDVRSLLTKVELGEVDAALVYRTDALAAGDSVRAIDLPTRAQVTNDYLVTVVRGAEDSPAAQGFVTLVHSAFGRTALRKAGFTLP